MDGLHDFLAETKRQGIARGNFLGLLNVVIGRRIHKKSGEVVANGVTWRHLAELLKKVRWDKQAVRELGLEPAALPPRDRQRYWYLAIAHAGIDSPQAASAGDRFAALLNSAGYVVGPAP
jgi:hypothetical protein